MALSFDLVLLLAAVLLSPPALAVMASPAAAIFGFGDGNLDVGNGKYLPEGDTLTFPYGLDLPNSVKTVRFSNGYNSMDFIAKYLGHEMSPPPFLSLLNFPLHIFSFDDIIGGVNFASEGSGLSSDLCDNGKRCIKMDTQIKYLNMIRSSIVGGIGEVATNLLLSKSLFLISIGTSDINHFIMSTICNTSEQQRDMFVADLTSKFLDKLTGLYNLGARRFGIVNVPMVGFYPDARVLTEYCSNILNELARKFNHEVEAKLGDLSSKMEGMKYSIANAYEMHGSIRDAPAKYGLKDVSDACCEGGCTPKSTYCANRSEYLFWDDVHATDAICSAFATEIYGGSQFVGPINLKQLINGEASPRKTDILPPKFLGGFEE